MHRRGQILHAKVNKLYVGEFGWLEARLDEIEVGGAVDDHHLPLSAQEERRVAQGVLQVNMASRLNEQSQAVRRLGRRNRKGQGAQ
eukprot:scaffold223387_cov30-Tisochrysis_lutea.AAC.2